MGTMPMTKKILRDMTVLSQLFVHEYLENFYYENACNSARLFSFYSSYKKDNIEKSALNRFTDSKEKKIHEIDVKRI